MENNSAADSVDTKVEIKPKSPTLDEGEDESPDKKLCTSQLLPSIDLHSSDYSMNHEKRGLAIIFNHFKFDSQKYKNSQRYGTKKDRERLEKTFELLDFDVQVHNDRNRLEITKILQDAAAIDHRNNDCIVVVVLSHGNKGRLEALDGTYDVDELLEPILNSQSLIGKPKLFFIQACRGVKGDPGFAATAKDQLCPFLSGGDMMDSTEFRPQYFKIPSTADLLVMYATYEGCFAWRNPDMGSYFIQALCDEFDANGAKDDLLRLLTGVNRKVAFQFQSNVPGSSKLNAMKQMPSIVSMLTKTLNFTVKGTTSTRSENCTTSGY
ncbi:caspase-1-like [Bradysia coprophila]|uniref:caspase-1-like n=1 Tax=Bradysia coprophila TaxID=38358 RepID=UPI00187D8535|nr:caspase-1-like [Bradysia coprophila]